MFRGRLFHFWSLLLKILWSSSYGKNELQSDNDQFDFPGFTR